MGFVASPTDHKSWPRLGQMSIVLWLRIYRRETFMKLWEQTCYSISLFLQCSIFVSFDFLIFVFFFLAGVSREEEENALGKDWYATCIFQEKKKEIEKQRLALKNSSSHHMTNVYYTSSLVIIPPFYVPWAWKA